LQRGGGRTQRGGQVTPAINIGPGKVTHREGAGSRPTPYAVTITAFPSISEKIGRSSWRARQRICRCEVTRGARSPGHRDGVRRSGFVAGSRSRIRKFFFETDLFVPYCRTVQAHRAAVYYCSDEESEPRPVPAFSSRVDARYSVRGGSSHPSRHRKPATPLPDHLVAPNPSPKINSVLYA